MQLSRHLHPSHARRSAGCRHPPRAIALSDFVSATQANSRQHKLAAAASASHASDGGNTSGTAQHSDEYSADFKRTRLVTFASLWVGYASFYITRNALNFVNPIMLQDASLGLDLTMVGSLTSLLPIAYAFSKGLSGVLGSTTSPRVLLAAGLASTAAACLAFGAGSSYLWFAIFWTANGLLQGLGSPACARLLTSWYSASERGTAWSIWTASNNVGGFLAPLVAGTAAGALGWRYGMWIPGAIALAVASIIFFTIRDSPKQCGFPSVDAPKPKDGGSTGKDAGGEEVSVLGILKQDVLPNPWVWLFALSYFFVYLVRQGTSSWFVHYLMNVKGVDDLAVAAAQVSGLEVGGFFGALSAGMLSDVLVRRAEARGETGKVGVRTRVVLLYGLATAAALVAFSICPSVPALQWACVAFVGFGLYGPQMLIGLCGAEVVRPEAVGATQGLLGWISYLGAACAGAPLAYAVQRFGWSMYFTTMTAAALIACALVLPMLRLKSYNELRDAEATAR